MTGFVPGYMALYRSGELRRRAEALAARLSRCDICPRHCGADRRAGEVGFCRSGYLPLVASFCDHRGEEPVLSGSRGSGTIFFGNCNMRCVYCQNYQISQSPSVPKSWEVDFKTLAGHMLYLQDELGCHNINFVSPPHFVPQIMLALLEAVPMGLRLPLVYNTSGYDSLATLGELEGIISIYLPDLRYASDERAKELSQAADYVEHARAAIKEMYRQVGELVLDDSGVAQQGLLVRHLVLPHGLAGSRESLTWLAREVSPRVAVSIMSQYYPAHRARQFPLLARRILYSEYAEVVQMAEELGLEQGWWQGMGAAERYLPDFRRPDSPFDATIDP